MISISWEYHENCMKLTKHLVCNRFSRNCCFYFVLSQKSVAHYSSEEEPWYSDPDVPSSSCILIRNVSILNIPRAFSTCLHCIPGSHPSDSWAWCPQQQDGPVQETGRAMMLQRNWSKTSRANRACLNREEPRKSWHWPLLKISGDEQKIFFNSKATRGLNLWRILVFKDYSRKEHLEDFWVADRVTCMYLRKDGDAAMTEAIVTDTSLKG